ncbi:MAG: hypothetical protein IPJ13_30540 [Saprospiraceae bacterium]|nr:hypothetical protein [Saprospiraceae bacterium]
MKSETVKLTKADKELISKAIAHCKATGEKLSVPHPKSKPSKTKKEVNHEAITQATTYMTPGVVVG